MKNILNRSKVTQFIRPPFNRPLYLPMAICVTAIYGERPKQIFQRQMAAASTLRQKRRIDFIHERNQRLCCTLEQYDQRAPVRNISPSKFAKTMGQWNSGRYERLLKYFFPKVWDSAKMIGHPPNIASSVKDLNKVNEKLREMTILNDRRIMKSFSPFDHLIMIAQQRLLTGFGYPSRRIIVLPFGFPRAPGPNSTYAERRKYREEKKAYRKKHAISYDAFGQIIKQIEHTLKMDRFFKAKFNNQWIIATREKGKAVVKNDERYHQWQQLLSNM